MNQNCSVQLEGVIPIIPTPFHADEQIKWPALRQLLDFACSVDVCAVCLPAYASEFYKLTDKDRREIIGTAASHVGGRRPVIAQANGASAIQAAELARFAQQSGAAAVAVAVPRQFAVPESDILRYYDRILRAIDIPLLLQDVNPGGTTVSPGFVARLHRMHPHFRWVKLEEPAMSGKVRAILDETSGEVGVLEGWGGMYVMELTEAGICGVMPGLGVADLLASIFRLVRAGQKQQAFEIFQGILPQITFSLQNMELYHHAEKRLLTARGVIEECAVRDLSMTLSPGDASHIAFLNANVLALLDRLGMPRHPAPAAVAATDN